MITQIKKLINIVTPLDKEIDLSLDWLKVFDTDDLKIMQEECVEAYKASLVAQNWQELEDVLYEWYESSLAIQNNEIYQAFKSVQ